MSPARSSKQYRLMQAAAHGRVNIGGIDRNTAKRYIKETPKKKRSLFSRSYK